MSDSVDRENILICTGTPFDICRDRMYSPNSGDIWRFWRPSDLRGNGGQCPACQDAEKNMVTVLKGVFE